MLSDLPIKNDIYFICNLSKIKMDFIYNDFLSFHVRLQPCGAEEDLTTIILTLKLIGRQFLFDTNRTFW